MDDVIPGAPVLERETPLDRVEDAFALFDEAIADLHRLGGDAWTNFNRHDPGVTFLEAFCYGLADVGYLANSDLVDLLTSEDGELDLTKLGLYPPAAMFPSSPVSDLDYRKVVLDEVREVQNVWFEDAPETLRATGYRNVRYFIGATQDEALAPEEAERIGNSVLKCLMRHRALGDFFIDPQPVPLLELIVEATIEDSGKGSTERMLSEMSDLLREALTPAVRFAPKSASSTEPPSASSGPTLQRGHLDDAQLWDPISLEEAVRRAEDAISTATERHAASIIALQIRPHGRKLQSSGVYKVCLHESAILIRRGSAHSDQHHTLPEASVLHSAFFEALPEASDEHIAGTYLGTGSHRSTQRDLPSVYRLDTTNVPFGAGPSTASAYQLKSYLSVFDQILANESRRVRQLPGLLSPFEPEGEWWTEPVYDVPGVAPLLTGFPEPHGTIFDQHAARARFEHDPNNSYRTALRLIDHEWRKDGELRRGLLQHLLARFGQELVEESERVFETNAQLEAWLQAMPQLSRDRARAPSYAEDPNSSLEELSTVEQLAAVLLSLPGSSMRRPLTVDTPEYSGRAYYLIEHGALLSVTPDLAPAPPDHERCTAEADDESHDYVRLPLAFFTQRLTHVFVNWNGRPSASVEFRRFVERTLAPHIPAHLLVEARWLTAPEMSEFASRYGAWLRAERRGVELDRNTRCCARHVTVLKSGPGYPLLEFLFQM